MLQPSGKRRQPEGPPAEIVVFAANAMALSISLGLELQLVLEVKENLEKGHAGLPQGKNGRDDDAMILWFLKDRKFSVEDTIVKLTRAIKWREEFGVSNLSEESVKSIYETGKAYLHDFTDVDGRSVLVVVASKHFPEKHDAVEDQKLCVFLIEKALRKLPDDLGEILVIVDLRGFRPENADFMFLKLINCCSPSILKVRFCDADAVRNDYFKEDTVPEAFKGLL
ncbi:hypothetical protein AXF42_Ash012833 [Apostasia shenzhenica]|uniref:CRAL-TRIO domain-containing protein n=1 Tax=Apostasia shenzhenica TaxID=1088818 RepID=A0A2I0AMC8_9ASPA|nr:hypothetical protein AXF42_Ash012833 [Apostasia shenzhenica]